MSKRVHPYLCGPECHPDCLTDHLAEPMTTPLSRIEAGLPPVHYEDCQRYCCADCDCDCTATADAQALIARVREVEGERDLLRRELVHLRNSVWKALNSAPPPVAAVVGEDPPCSRCDERQCRGCGVGS